MLGRRLRCAAAAVRWDIVLIWGAGIALPWLAILLVLCALASL